MPVSGSFCPQPSPSRRLGREKEGRGSNAETTVPELGRGRVFAPDFEKQGQCSEGREHRSLAERAGLCPLPLTVAVGRLVGGFQELRLSHGLAGVTSQQESRPQRDDLLP